MIAKSRELPLTIVKLEALLRRLPPAYPKRLKIERDLAKRQAGFNGEESVDIHFDSLPEHKYHIFQDLCLNNGTYNFQIDSLVLSNHFALIIEVKNISGTLYFDRTFNQLIRTFNDKEEGFPDPILQVKRHQRELVSWIEEKTLKPLPVEFLVIISNPSTVIKLKSGYSREYEKICHSADLEHKIKELERKHSKEVISQKELKKLSRLLLKEHSPHNTNILETYAIPCEDLLTGVICPSCSNLPMIRKKGFWLCPSCHSPSKHAHFQALHDYFHLIKPSITNTEFRDFLQISSRHVSKRILHSMDLPSAGENKGRIYFQTSP
ncbi:nuclease-related domain-containing protein [Bacillus sp. V59.32b]|uniref:nuclease-related domain-containing protein n=1 Tax=Bacillus sp. V59.32b TaxID=1758642 RepID=UPI000E3DB0CD|nr:nuclease-related domain-containing protein [Bacillus sp. V59.32b]RFU67443.1 NERD domain-containing protein [Bacillus sp. V59.32b]